MRLLSLLQLTGCWPKQHGPTCVAHSSLQFICTLPLPLVPAMTRHCVQFASPCPEVIRADQMLCVVQEYGHRVRLASHAVYREFVTSFGLSFYPLGGRPEVNGCSPGCSSGMLTLSENLMIPQQASGVGQQPLLSVQVLSDYIVKNRGIFPGERCHALCCMQLLLLLGHWQPPETCCSCCRLCSTAHHHIPVLGLPLEA